MSLHRILVLGGGSIGERHVRCFQQTGRADVQLCEVNESVRERVAKTYSLSASFADFDAALNSAAPAGSASPFAAAVVCTPAHLHIPMASRLAEAGCHLLIEKPLSTNLDGLPELHAAVAKKNTVVAVAYVLRAHPILSEMRAAIASGRFGQPLEIVSVSGQNFPFYRPAYRDIYYKDRATGGGAIQDAITHVLNAGQWLVGPFTELAADAAHLALEGVSVEDTVHVIARHGEVLGNYSLNQFQAPNEFTITVVCEQATVRFEAHQNRWRWQSKPDESWHDEVHPPVERDTSFVLQANAFLDAIEGQSQPLCSLADAEHTLRVNLATLRAADTHTWQRID